MKEELKSIFSLLKESGVSAALIGGLAVSVRVEPRFTRDIDLAVSVGTDEDSEAVVRLLLSNEYKIITSVEQTSENRLATVRFAPPQNTEDEVVVDLLFASSGIEPEIVNNAEIIEVMPNLSIPVAQTGHLIATKILSSDEDLRPQDLLDLSGLVSAASEKDLLLAKDSLALIVSRGFNRKRDLLTIFQSKVKQFRK